jgi:hypothetical protein
MRTVYNISVNVLIALLLGACGQSTKQENSKAAVEHEHVEEIALTEQQMQAVNIRFGEIEQRDLKSVVRANGQND